MPSVSDYTTVFRAKPAGRSSGAAHPPVDPNRRVVKRNRATVSCASCRSRKQRCDRRSPCSACARRGDACHYPSPGAAASSFPSSSSSSAAAAPGSSAQKLRQRQRRPGAATEDDGELGFTLRHEAQARLQRLEELVYSLVERSNQDAGGAAAGQASVAADDPAASPPPSSSSAPRPPPPFAGKATRGSGEHGDAAAATAAADRPEDGFAGAPSDMGEHLRSSEAGATTFFGATHWSAVLNCIQDLQGYLEGDAAVSQGPRQQQQQQHPPAAPSSLSSSSSLSPPSDPSPTPPSPHDAGGGGGSRQRSSGPGGASNSRGPDVVFGGGGGGNGGTAAATVSTQDVLKGLPPRDECDRLLCAYFAMHWASMPILHTAKFQRAYAAFWADPGGASLLWASMLFSVLALSSTMQWAASLAAGGGGGADDDDAPEAAGFAPPQEPPELERLRVMAARCLVAGEYMKARPYSVEALLLVNFARLYSIGGDGDPVLWAGFAVATRLAQRMGYHREPRHIGHRNTDDGSPASSSAARPTLTPFECEMRRRVWYFVEMFDISYSFHFGMPTVVHEDECDAEAPTNLLDSDFDEHSAEPPAARPDTDPTPMLYYCFKSRMVRLMRRVIRHALGLGIAATTAAKHTGRDRTEERRRRRRATLELDAELRAAMAAMPPSLRLALPIAAAAPAGETAGQVARRVTAELVGLKCLCVLHRSYLTVDRGRRRSGGDDDDDDDEQERQHVARCREACLDAASRILEIHAGVEHELRTGTRLRGQEYPLLGTVKHDFLLAATILCLDLTESWNASQEEKRKKLQAIETAYMLWFPRRNSSSDAVRVVKVLGAILRTARKTMFGPNDDAHPAPPQVPEEPQPQQKQQQQEVVEREESSAVTTETALPLTTTSGYYPATAPVAAAAAFEPQEIYFGQPSDFLADANPQVDAALAFDANNIDWDMIDSYLFDRPPNIPMYETDFDMDAFSGLI